MPKPRYRDGAAVLLLLALSAASIIVFHEFSGLHHDRHTQDPSLVSPAAVVATDRLMPAREPPAIPPEFEALVLARARGGVPTAAAEHASPQESTGALANHDRQREPPPPLSQPPPPTAEPKGEEFGGKLIHSTEALKREFDARLEALNALGKRYKQPACHAPDCWWQSMPEAQLAIASVQDAARALLAAKYGPEPYLVRAALEFPASMPDPAGPAASLTWRMAPTAAAPYAVLHFLEHVVSGFVKGAFHRNGGHVLQAQVAGGGRPLVFQEYDAAWPHVKNTLGYAGRPGSGAFYINIIDNTRNHGPDKKGESDAGFGKLIETEAVLAVVERIKKMPGISKPMGFVANPDNHVRIRALELLRGDERADAIAAGGLDGT